MELRSGAGGTVVHKPKATQGAEIQMSNWIRSNSGRAFVSGSALGATRGPCH